MSVDDWHKLIRFYALQDARTPSRLDIYLSPEYATRFEKLFQDTVEEGVRTFTEMRRRKAPIAVEPLPAGPAIPFKIATARIQGGPTGLARGEVVLGRESWHHMIYCMATSVYKHLLAYKWNVLAAPEGVNWVTSDHPAIGHKDGKYFGLHSQLGWNHPGLELMMPISPTRMLYTRVGDRHQVHRGISVGYAEAERLNNIIINRAHRFVIANQKLDGIESLRQSEADAERFAKERKRWQRFNADNRSAIEDLSREISSKEIDLWQQGAYLTRGAL